MSTDYLKSLTDATTDLVTAIGNADKAGKANDEIEKLFGEIAEDLKSAKDKDDLKDFKNDTKDQYRNNGVDKAVEQVFRCLFFHSHCVKL